MKAEKLFDALIILMFVAVIAYLAVTISPSRTDERAYECLSSITGDAAACIHATQTAQAQPPAWWPWGH